MEGFGFYVVCQQQPTRVKTKAIEWCSTLLAKVENENELECFWFFLQKANEM